MNTLAWLIVALATVEAGWMEFDGLRALVVGDYVMPTSGAYAGQLGPWAHLVQRLGINPRSTGMKRFFAAYGLVWLAVIAAFIFSPAGWAWWAMLLLAIGAFWYLPIGTMFSLVQIILLFINS